MKVKKNTTEEFYLPAKIDDQQGHPFKYLPRTPLFPN